MNPDSTDMCWRSNKPWHFLVAVVIAALAALLPNARVPAGIMLAVAAASLICALFLLPHKITASGDGLTVRSLLLPRTYSAAEIRGVAYCILTPPKYRRLAHTIFILFHRVRAPLLLREEEFNCPPGSMTAALQDRFGVVEMPPDEHCLCAFEAVERRCRLVLPMIWKKVILISYLCVLASLIFLGRNELIGRRTLEVLLIILILTVPLLVFLTQVLPARIVHRIVRSFDGRCLHCGENLPNRPTESCSGCGSNLAEQDVVRKFWGDGA